MHLPTKPKAFVATILIILTLTVSFYSVLPTVHAATTVLTVTPTNGTVGQSVSVNGTIVTLNGAFNIFFDSAIVKSGNASDYYFSASFIVPQATYGPHNIKLQDAKTGNSTTQSFIVQMSYTISPVNLPAAPGQLQEGDSVQLKAQIFGGNPSATYNKTITVTAPTSSVYNSTFQLITNQSGTAEKNLDYPTSFSSTGRNTNYTGTYQVRIYKNTTTVGAQSSFFVGLTNATSYHRFDRVNIKAMNYTKPNEFANVTIVFGNKQVNRTSIQTRNGQVILNWQVPANASIGRYTVTVKSLNSTGTVKSVSDVQNFTVPGFAVHFSTVNLNMENVGGVNATVYQIDSNTNKTSQAATGVTNSSGSVTYTLERGNYNVKAYWKNVQVNETALIPVQNNSSWTIICQLTRIALTVINEKTHNPLSFLLFVLNVTYHTSSNVLQNGTQFAYTNTTATCIFNNELINASYTVWVYRAQQLFNTTTLPPISSGTKTFNFNLTCPVLNLAIHTEDAKQATLSHYPIMIYDYGGGLIGNATTDSSGNCTFSLAFGQYRIRLYNKEETIVLNETIFTLVNASSLLLRSSICDANLSVKVVDYLGLPIPNVRVKLEREGFAENATTDGNGVAFFVNVTGGNSFISVYTGGKTPSYTANIYVEGNTVVSVSLGKYVSLFGIIIDTTQFAVLLTFIVFIIAFAFFIVYQRRKSKASAAEAAEKET